MDLISRQAAIDAHCELCDMNDKCICIYCKDIDMFESLPTAEKKGKWLMVEDVDNDGNARYECSLCHAGETHTPKVKVSYCWNCGARMEERDEHTD